MTNQPATREEWIEHNRQERVREGMSIAEQAMVQAVGEAAILEKLARCSMGEPNAKGRVHFIQHGEPGPAELKWHELSEHFRSKRKQPQH